MTKVLIINFNRLTLPKNMAEWLSARGVEPVFIDNNSDYPPLMEYYHHCPYKVMHMNKNYGHTVVWNPETTILQRLGITEPYIVTDPDLDLVGIPDDFLSVLQEGLNRFPQFDKCGFSLEINNLPPDKPSYHWNNGDYSIEVWESQFWSKPLDERYFEAPIDTTLALYRKNEYAFWGTRTNRPYTAKHVPWTYVYYKDLPGDEKYYYDTCNESASGRERIIR
jgi:hypothetical protein